MFNDWVPDRVLEQRILLDDWLARTRRLVVIELGAGLAIPTVRQLIERHGPRVVRINPVHFQIAYGIGVSVQSTALTALRMIDARLN